MIDCPDCCGDGTIEADHMRWNTCERCDGKGKIEGVAALTFEERVQAYLEDNLSLDVDVETSMYDSDSKTVTIRLKLGERIIASEYFYT